MNDDRDEQRARLRRTAALNAPVATVALTVGLTLLIWGGGGVHEAGIVLAGVGGGMFAMLVALWCVVAARRRR